MRNDSLWVIKKTAIVSLALYVLVYYGFIFLFPNQRMALSDVLTLVGEGTSLAIIGLGLRWQEAVYRTEWRLFALGIALNFLGDLIWGIYEVLFHQKVPMPSICDLFYISGCICDLIAFFYYLRQEKLSDIVRTGLDMAITMVVSTAIIYQYILLPISNDGTLTLFQKAISITYPIFDIGYLGGTFSLIFFCSKTPKFNLSNFLISTAFILWLFADQLYLVLSNFKYVSGGLVDPLWPIGCWVLALASLFPQTCGVREETLCFTAHPKKKMPVMENAGLLIPYISVTVMIIMVSYQYIFEDPLITGTVIAVLLILFRQILSLLENKRLICLIQESNQLLEESKAKLEKNNRELQQLNDQKEQEANTDYLTGIYNRRYLDELLRLYPETTAVDENVEISLLLIDVDHFKLINDQCGHEAGDSVLRQVAFLIKNAIRSEDIAGRFGGDEFLVILPNTNLQCAKLIADRILHKVILADYTENGRILNVSLSIGCTQWKGPIADYDVNTIIFDADKALYRAKAGGRNQCSTGNSETAGISSI